MKRIYVAAPFAGRPYALTVATRLIEAGHIVTSGWVRSTGYIDQAAVGPATATEDELATDHAQGDLNDIDRSDVVLMLTGPRVQEEMPGIPDAWLTSGGRHFECGYATAKGKSVHIIGEPENIFSRAFAHHHPDVEAFLDSVNTTKEVHHGVV